jgi:hypothetical protein
MAADWQKVEDGEKEESKRNKPFGHLRDAISDCVMRHGNLPPPQRPSRLAHVAARMEGAAGEGGQRLGKNYDDIATAIAGAIGANDSISTRRLRDGAWCLWETKPALAEVNGTLSEFLRRCRSARDGRAARGLLSAYLTQWHVDRPGLHLISEACSPLATVAGNHFAEAQNRYRLFSLPAGPDQLGRAAVERRRAPPSLLADLGFSDSIARGGFSLPCTRAALETASVTADLAPRERMELVRDLALLPDGGLISPTLRPAFANALLLPYADRPPPEDVKQETINLVTKVLGDPRTKSWIGMDRARKIMLGWLTKLALSHFLDVVEAVNPDPNWKYRRRFWEAMNEVEAITGAWAILSNAGEAEARRRFGRETPFATFHRGSVQAGHAVLLMQIGPGICAEWSFNGKCRFWADATRAGAPKMYERSYDADFLRTGRAYAPVLEVVHYPHRDSHPGVETAWQHKVYRRISGMTGVRLPSASYM